VSSRLHPTVWKFKVYPPEDDGRSFIDLPVRTVLLSVGIQDDDVMVVWGWVPRPDDERIERRRLIVVNTGMDIRDFRGDLPYGGKFLGTVTTSNGIVWHVWENSGLYADRRSCLAERLETLLTLDDVALTLRISRRGVQRLVEAGELRPVKIGALTRVFPADLRMYLERRQAAQEAVPT